MHLLLVFGHERRVDLDTWGFKGDFGDEFLVKEADVSHFCGCFCGGVMLPIVYGSQEGFPDIPDLGCQ